MGIKRRVWRYRYTNFRNPTRGSVLRVFVFRLFILSILPTHVNNGPPSPYAIDVKIGDVMHEPKDVQEPHHHGNNHDRIQ